MFACMILHENCHVNTLNGIILLQKSHNLSKTQMTPLDFCPGANFALHVKMPYIYPCIKLSCQSKHRSKYLHIYCKKILFNFL